jgi:hypothetical protein
MTPVDDTYQDLLMTIFERPLAGFKQRNWMSDRSSSHHVEENIHLSRPRM